MQDDASEGGGNRTRIVNALTVDVEEHFHAAALAETLPRDCWASCESRVFENTRRTLDLFAEMGAKATFFTLGSVAERHPSLVRAILKEGHEIASHGYDHFRVSKQTPQEFAADVRRTKQILENAGGQEVLGYRAANFSIDSASSWAYDVLAEVGYHYSSSVNPIRHDHYGDANAPRMPYQPSQNRVIEIPITTLDLFGVRLPAGGGGYFRLVPYSWFRWAVMRVNRREGQPANFYFHPWEVDPNQPRAPVRGRARFRHYVNLTAMHGKLACLLADFRWSRMDQVYSAILARVHML